MPFLVKVCEKKDKPHPCDPLPDRDPFALQVGDCEPPFICQERIKHPAGENEDTRCQAGSSMNAKKCRQPDPDHPCDPSVPCGVKGPVRNCKEPVICLHRIKNPEVPKRPITEDCDPTK